MRMCVLGCVWECVYTVQVQEWNSKPKSILLLLNFSNLSSHSAFIVRLALFIRFYIACRHSYSLLLSLFLYFSWLCLPRSCSPFLYSCEFVFKYIFMILLAVVVVVFVVVVYFGGYSVCEELLFNFTYIMNWFAHFCPRDSGILRVSFGFFFAFRLFLFLLKIVANRMVVCIWCFVVVVCMN